MSWQEYNRLLSELPPTVATDLAKIAATGKPVQQDVTSDVVFEVSINRVAHVLIQTRRKVARDYLIAGAVLFVIAAGVAVTVILVRF